MSSDTLIFSGISPSGVKMVEHHERELQRPGPVEADVAVARGAVLGRRARAAAPIALVVLRATSKPILLSDFPTKPQKGRLLGACAQDYRRKRCCTHQAELCACLLIQCTGSERVLRRLELNLRPRLHVRQHPQVLQTSNQLSSASLGLLAKPCGKEGRLTKSRKLRMVSRSPCARTL